MTSENLDVDLVSQSGPPAAPSEGDFPTTVLPPVPAAPAPRRRGIWPFGRGQAAPEESALMAVRLEAGPTAAELQARDITAWFGDHKVLDRVSLTMAAGQITSLIGPSGCGKSTFLRILNRMHEMIPSATLAGQVILGDHNIYAPDVRVTHARRDIGMVFQKPNPFPAMSIYENTIAALDLCGLKATKAEKDYLVEDSLKKASLWEEVKDRLHQPGGGLSGGQQQRLCIARALAISPKVLLMDEPCSALDPTSTRRVEETIAELRGQVTVVIVTHNMQQAARVSDQCAFFLAAQNTPGVIVEYGDTTAMFNNPQDERTYDYVNGRFG
jgi:phosphate transport system ATP-binding protein